MKQIEKKILPKYFDEVITGRKNFELRKDENNFEVGDIMVLREWNDEKKFYTGRYVKKIISYILRNAPEYGLMDGYCIIGFMSEVSIPAGKGTITSAHNEGDYPGIALFYEDKDGAQDLARIEFKDNKASLYLYEDAEDDDFTKKINFVKLYEESYDVYSIVIGDSENIDNGFPKYYKKYQYGSTYNSYSEAFQKSNDLTKMLLNDNELYDDMVFDDEYVCAVAIFKNGQPYRYEKIDKARKYQVKFQDVNICDICEKLSTYPGTSHLVDWYGDYAVWEPSVNATMLEIYEAYDKLQK